LQDLSYAEEFDNFQIDFPREPVQNHFAPNAAPGGGYSNSLREHSLSSEP